MKHPGKTQPFLGPKGEVVPGSIAEANYLHLGGLGLARSARLASWLAVAADGASLRS